jgi:hypothetical protein
MCPVGYSCHLVARPNPGPVHRPWHLHRLARGEPAGRPVTVYRLRGLRPCGGPRALRGGLLASLPRRASGGRMEAKTAADGQAKAVRCFGGVIHRPRRSGFAGGPVVLRGEGAKSVSFPCSPAGPARASRLARGMFARRGVCPSPAPSPARWRSACARCWRLASRV